MTTDTTEPTTPTVTLPVFLAVLAGAAATRWLLASHPDHPWLGLTLGVAIVCLAAWHAATRPMRSSGAESRTVHPLTLAYLALLFTHTMHLVVRLGAGIGV